MVVKQVIAFARETQGPQKTETPLLAGAFRDAVFSGDDRMIEVVVDVAGNEEVEQAVVIVVAPGGTCGPAASVTPAFSATSVKLPSCCCGRDGSCCSWRRKCRASRRCRSRDATPKPQRSFRRLLCR